MTTDTTVAVGRLKQRLYDLEEEATELLLGKSLLLTSEWPERELNALSSLAEAFEALDRRHIKTPLLQGELAYALFFDDSTRTKSAWAGAAARLGMSPVIVDGASTHVAHGETAEETGAMLGMNAHALGVRHDVVPGQGTPFMRDMLRGIQDYLLATRDPRQVPMVNLQCDVDHPTQCMADLLWLKEYYAGSLQGKKVAVTWAHSPSSPRPPSVPQGLITLLPRFGCEVTLAHPEGYDLSAATLAAAKQGAAEGGGSFRTVSSMDEAFRGAQVVYPKSWGGGELLLERAAASDRGDQAGVAEVERRAREQSASHRDWICDARRMGLTSEALYMHCLPADPGAEVDPEVLRSFQLQVAKQANKKVYVIMALLAGAKVRGLWGRLLELLD